MIRIYLPDEFPDIPSTDDFDAASVARDSACAHLVSGGARCSIWWGGALADTETGCIGHFTAQDEGAGLAVLDAAVRLLHENGCTHALAPMNGNTWRSYRYATGGSARPTFLLEPPPAFDRDKLLLDSGFLPAQQYVSYIEPLEQPPAPEPEKLAASGVAIRPLEPDRLEEELSRVYRLAVLAFRENPYYTDLPKQAFLRQYLGYRAIIVPDLVLLAERGEELAGFLFCLPDYAQGERPDTILLKTIAVDPAYRALGLGGALVREAQARAYAMGFRHSINALIYCGNISERLCHGELLREYTLYGRAL